MARKTKEEILNAFAAIVGDDDRDEVLAFMEDLADSMIEGDTEEIERLRADLETERARYDENERAWRRRYKERFYRGADDNEDGETVIEKKEKIEKKDEPTGEEVEYEDLFEEKDEKKKEE